MEDLSSKRRNLSAPNIANCASATYKLRIDASGRKVLVLASCANWGDIGRVHADLHAKSYGEAGFNTALLSDPEQPTVESIDENITDLGRKCAQICDGCDRYEPIAKAGWPRTISTITTSREATLVDLGLAQTA